MLTVSVPRLPVQETTVIQASAEEEYEDYTEDVYRSLVYKKYADYIEISGYTDEAENEITIPAEIDGLPVTSIGTLAFSNFYSLTSVIIPDGVTTIGNRAFSGCTSLTSVTIPESVQSFGWYVFDYTPWLYQKQEENPFVIINHILIDGALCKGEIIVPEGVTAISATAFYYCSDIISVTLPDGITSIGGGAFSNCSSLTSVNLPDSITNIGEEAFYGCSALTSIAVPEGVTCILPYTFYECSSLTSITLPDTLISIESWALDDCTALTSVFIPKGVTSIASGFLKGCSAAVSIDVDEENTVFSSKDGVLFNKEQTVLLRFPSGNEQTEYVIPETVTGIAFHAFRDCSHLLSIRIENPDCEIIENKYTLPEQAVIYGYENSTAQAYAEKYGYQFEVIGSEPETESRAEEFLSGDADLSGKVDILDVITLNRAILGKETLTENQIKAIDFNQNGKPDSEESLMILKYITGLIEAL